MKETVESPFVDRESVEQESWGGWQPPERAPARESPFSAVIGVAGGGSGTSRAESVADAAEEEALAPWPHDLYAESGETDEFSVDETEPGYLEDFGEATEYEDLEAARAELDPSAAELDEFDTAGNEYEAMDSAANEYEAAHAFLEVKLGDEAGALGAEMDAELFQRLVPLGPALEPALVGAQIALGKRDPNALTDFVFFFRHPELKGTRLSKGQESLMAEWRGIRDEVVRPALARAASPAASAAPGVAGAPAGPLGTLVCSVPGRKPFSYAFTPADLLWTARFINGEAGGRDDAQNRSIIWAMFNRYAFFRDDYPAWGSFGDFVRKYSTPLQPNLKKYEQVKRWVAQCNATFDNPGCNYQPTTSEVYPGTTIRKGQLKTFLRLQQTAWSALKESSRRLALQALGGQVENPIGNVSEFGDTAVYFARKHGSKPTREQWERYTRDYAAQKGWSWRPAQTPYDEYGNNVLFINGAAKGFPPNVTRVVPPSGSAPRVTRPPPSSTVPSPATPPGDPNQELLYDGSTPAPGTAETRRSFPTSPPLTGSPTNRNRMLYDNVINQFAVEVNPRYGQKFKDGKMTSTYCNIFCWDVTRAMGAEVPHWVSNRGEPVERGKGQEMNANATYDWLRKHGSRYGWRRASSAEEAQALANRGYPVVAALKKAGGIGHVAIIRPGEVTDKGPAMAQAGARNRNHTRMYSVFGGGSAVDLWGSDS